MMVATFTAVALAQPTQPRVLTSAAVAASRAYDYIAVGGGTGGLAIASRLSQAGYSVLVVEAGDDDRTKPLIDDLQNYWRMFQPGCTVNWKYVTRGWHGRNITVPAGKTLGDSSSINGGMWTWGSAAQYDAISRLGNDPAIWSATSLAAHRRSAEMFAPPETVSVSVGPCPCPCVT